jgi:hypothetical protein
MLRKIIALATGIAATMGAATAVTLGGTMPARADTPCTINVGFGTPAPPSLTVQDSGTNAYGTLVVGDDPHYFLNGAPSNCKIYWSSTLNGLSTGEVNDFYGHYTNQGGHWDAYGGTWTTANIGRWTKTATIYPTQSVDYLGIVSQYLGPPVTATVSFTVSNR